MRSAWWDKIAQDEPSLGLLRDADGTLGTPAVWTKASAMNSLIRSDIHLVGLMRPGHRHRQCGPGFARIQHRGNVNNGKC